jgi:hypothetical protein
LPKEDVPIPEGNSNSSRSKVSKSYLSQICHLLTFNASPATRLKKSMMIISIDIDAGSKLLGYINGGKNDAAVHKHLSEATIGQIEETALPLFVELFENVGIPATFAVRGQLLDCCDGSIDRLLDSCVAHDIGAHGYSHKQFSHLSCAEADYEIGKTTEAIKKLGITPHSFIFPRNTIAHLDILERYGYKCFRSNGGLRHDAMQIEKIGNIYKFFPSMLLDQDTDLTIVKRFLNIGIAKKGPLHFWFHLWNFGKNEKTLRYNVEKCLKPFLQYAEQRRQQGLLSFETMDSAVKKIENSNMSLK